MSDQTYTFLFDHIIPGSETEEWSDFVVEFTLSQYRAATLREPEEPSEIEIEDIFMLEGDERLQIDEDAFEALSAYLIQMKSDEMFQAAQDAMREMEYSAAEYFAEC